MYAKTAPLTGDSRGSPEVGRGFPERLRQAMGGASAYAFAKRCGFAESLLRKYLTGASLPGLDKLAAIAEAGGVSLDWLILGRPFNGQHTAVKTPDGEDELLSLPHWDHDNPGPDGLESNPPALHLCFRRSFLEGRGLSVGDLGLVTARGDAMEPTIRDGDLLMTDTSQCQAINGVFVLRRGQTYQPRRLQWGIPDGVLVKTDNETYDDHRVDPAQQESLELVGRVVGVFAGLWPPCGPQAGGRELV